MLDACMPLVQTQVRCWGEGEASRVVHSKESRGEGGGGVYGPVTRHK